MTTPFHDDVVVDVDGDGVRSVRGTAPGPAGFASLDVAAGVAVHVDFADPSVLCAVDVEPGGDMSALGGLVGADRGRRAGEVAEGSPARRLPGTRARGRAGRLGSYPMDQPAHQLAVVTVLASLADDPRRSPLARLASAAEVLDAAAHGVQGLLAVRPLQRRMRRVLAAQLDVAHHEAVWLAAHEPSLARRLARLVARVADTVDAAALVAALRVATRAASPAVSGGAPLIEQRPGRVTATTSDGRGQWLRVVDTSTMVLHAVVPFVWADHEWRADAVVPPDRGVEHLLVEVTDDPTPAGSSTIARVQHAVVMGRRAVEQALAGHHGRAERSWNDCAAAWRALGDEARAERAADYARGRALPGRPASLGERIHAVLTGT